MWSRQQRRATHSVDADVRPSISSSHPSGRGRLKHAYDDLAGAVMRRLRKIGGEEAVADFAMERAQEIVSDVPVSGTFGRRTREHRGTDCRSFDQCGIFCDHSSRWKWCADLPAPLPGGARGRRVPGIVRGRNRGLHRETRYPRAASGNDRQRRLRMHHPRATCKNAGGKSGRRPVRVGIGSLRKESHMTVTDPTPAQHRRAF